LSFFLSFFFVFFFFCSFFVFSENAISILKTKEKHDTELQSVVNNLTNKNEMQLAEIAADTALLLSMKDSELKRLQKLRTKEKEEMKKEKQLHYLDLEKERKEMNERRIHEINMEKNRYEGKVTTVSVVV
jgi:carboxylesterase type B